MNTFKRFISIMTMSIVFLSGISNSAMSIAEDNPLSSDKINADLLEAMESGEEILPVVIWLGNIDNTVVEQMVKDRTGLSIDNIEEHYIDPDPELIEQLSNASLNPSDYSEKYLQELMKINMELSAPARELEALKTDLYLNTWRDISKDLITAQNEKFEMENNILENEIMFSSRYAPMIICELPIEKIIDLSEDARVQSMSLYTEAEYIDCSTNDVMGITNILNYTNLTGNGTNIGIYEVYTINPSHITEFNLNPNHITIVGTPNIGTSHPANSASIAAGNDGIAPNAHIYSVSYLEDKAAMNAYTPNSQMPLQRLQLLMDEYVDVINMSFGYLYPEGEYDLWSKFTDYLIQQFKVSVVCAVGNREDNPIYDTEVILSPARAYNTIAVSGFHENYNGTNESVIGDYSYKYGNGCVKPDVIAKGENGTSSAAPVITGMLALLYEYKPSLKASPEMAKAILMASCHNKLQKAISNHTLINLTDYNQALSSRQGAGIPDMYRMIAIASQHSYGNGVLNATDDYVHFVQPTYNSSKINIAMTFIQPGVSNSSNPVVINDCDLYVDNNNSTKMSLNKNSSTEMIYSTLTNDDEYTLNVRRYSQGSTPIKYAYAWSTDNERFNENCEDEGIYFIRNKKSSYYLTKNTGNNRCIQSAYNGSLNAMWVMDYITATGKYTVKNGNLTSYGLCLDSLISGNNYYVKDNTNNQVNPITIVCNNDKSYTFKQTVGNTTYALGINANSTSAGAYATWSPYSDTNESQKWLLETANYRIGDVNTDGVINNDDVLMLQSVDAHLITLDNIQSYLGDANKSDSINLADALTILQMIANS